jgi:hypothetical protein
VSTFYRTRFGKRGKITSKNRVEVMRKLAAELRQEVPEEPDYEETQVSICNEHWSVFAQVSGLISFENTGMPEEEDSILPDSMHLSDIPDKVLFDIWSAVIEENKEKLLSFKWKKLEDLPPYKGDYYNRG